MIEFRIVQHAVAVAVALVGWTAGHIAIVCAVDDSRGRRAVAGDAGAIICIPAVVRETQRLMGRRLRRDPSSRHDELCNAWCTCSVSAEIR